MREKPENGDSARPGPDPERLDIEGDWKDAMKKAMRKKKPADGWPKQSSEEQS